MSSTEGKTIQCRAAIAWGPKKPLTIETIDVAPPKAGEVRIRLHSASICLTDNTLLSGVDVGYPKPIFPSILGHEGAGVVESVGEGVTSLKAGDHVMPCAMPQCRKCRLCQNPHTMACLTVFENISDGSIGVNGDTTTRFSCNGKTVFHFEGVSSFSEYTVCRESAVTKINPAASLAKVSPISCGIMTGYGAAVNSAGIWKGSICAVYGLGTVGLAAVAGCKKMEAGKIIAVDVNSAKFEVAKKLGATDCINPNDSNLEEAIAKLTAGEGADFAIECVGNHTVLRRAIDNTSKYWGKTLVVGATPVTSEFTTTNSMQFLFGRVLAGSWMGGKKTRDHLAKLVEDYLKGDLPVDDFITHRVDLDHINEGFEYLRAGKCVKTVIDLL